LGYGRVPSKTWLHKLSAGVVTSFADMSDWNVHNRFVLATMSPMSKIHSLRTMKGTSHACSSYDEKDGGCAISNYAQAGEKYWHEAELLFLLLLAAAVNARCTDVCYMFNESRNQNRCKTSCECDGERTCSPAGWCQGSAGPVNQRAMCPNPAGQSTLNDC
jgi:hypothetical protein